MYPASAAFFEALAHSHKVTSRAEVLDTGQFAMDLEILGGAVTVDGNAAQQRTLRCNVVDPTGDLTPASLRDMLAPAGNELRIWRGISTPALTEEVPLGVFGISDVHVQANTTGGTSLAITGSDRSKLVEESLFTEPYYQREGDPYSFAIVYIVGLQAGGTFIGFDTSLIQSVDTETSVMVHSIGDDPWKVVADMAKSVGCDLYFDQLGRLNLHTTPEPDDAPVAMAYEEGPTARILGVSKKLTRQFTYNGVVAVGESSAITDQAAEPVAAVAWDDNPASPTYYLGKFGKKPRIYASPFIKTRAQAQTAAAAILRTAKGMAEDVAFTGLVNPAHEVGDVVTIKQAKSKVDGRYVLSSFTIPLTYAEAMSATTRRRTA